MSNMIFGATCLIIFYAFVFAVAFWARRFIKKSSEEEMVLAGRRLGFFLSTMTLTATWVGAGVWTGGAEKTFSEGLIWNQAPIFYFISMLACTLLLLKPLREAKVVTILDLFKKDYGSNTAVIYTVIILVADLILISAVLNAVGASLVSLLDISLTTSIIFSSIFVGLYTSMGSMFAVVYTDVVQLVFMTFGIVIALPFVCSHEAVDTSKITTNVIFGSIELKEIPQWIDFE